MMSGRSVRRLGAGLLAACAVALAAAVPAMAATIHSTGTTSDGGTWIADVPANWNGTLLLYSHGYGTLSPQDAPDPNTQAALLADGYALAGSGYDPNGSLWALGSAVRDQFQTLQAVKKTVLPSRPTQVLAFGTSMGGLISALEDQQSNGRLDGALTTCGLVAGGIQLNNYQLDGEYALNKLLARRRRQARQLHEPGRRRHRRDHPQQRGRAGTDDPGGPRPTGPGDVAHGRLHAGHPARPCPASMTTPSRSSSSTTWSSSPTR